MSEVSAEDIKKAQRLLDEIQILDAKVDRWADELDRCKVLVERMGAIDPDFPVVQGGIRSTGAEWDAFIKAQSNYDKAVDEYVDKKAIVFDALDRMENLTYVKIISYRYINKKALSWNEISQKMSLSKSYVHSMHEDALREFTSKLLEEAG